MREVFGRDTASTPSQDEVAASSSPLRWVGLSKLCARPLADGDVGMTAR
jgi:hypothetical protein